MDQMFNEIINSKMQLLELTERYFNTYVLFTWQWWLLLFLTIVPWIIWWKLVDRKRLVEISLFGFFIFVWVILSDIAGETYGLWDYPIGLLSSAGFSITADITVFTLSHMLLYQYFPTWKGYAIANLVYALIFAFLLEPIAIHIDLYVMLNWKHIYSFPIYFIKALIGKWLVEWIFRVAGRENLVK